MKRATLLAAVCLTALVTASPASAGYVTTFDFLKNTLTNSTLKITRTDTTVGRVVNQSNYRAGSGQNTNECDSANVDKIGGWLPNGWYSIWAHHNGFTGSIQGRVWQFQDKYCWDGNTKRTELFIHSEETSGQGQYCPTSGDDPFCWEGDFDYYSNGCIKVSRAAPIPTDLARLHDNWDAWSGLHGSFTLSQRLFVG